MHNKIKKEKNESEKCCVKNGNKEGALKGVLYGLVPHIGCIAFIIASVLGATAMMNFFRPLLMNRYFFHALILVSLGFASFSAFFYLRRNGLLSFDGAVSRWKYLSVMYGSTVGINLLLFMVIFPIAANASAPVNLDDFEGIELSEARISVNIPCPGHAPLIIEELRKSEGVAGVRFSFPNYFSVSYDPDVTSAERFLARGVFIEYPAKVLG